MPLGISIKHGEPADETPKGLIKKIWHIRKLQKEKVICVADTSKGYLYAVNESFLKKPEYDKSQLSKNEFSLGYIV